MSIHCHLDFTSPSAFGCVNRFTVKSATTRAFHRLDGCARRSSAAKRQQAMPCFHFDSFTFGELSMRNRIYVASAVSLCLVVIATAAAFALSTGHDQAATPVAQALESSVSCACGSGCDCGPDCACCPDCVNCPDCSICQDCSCCGASCCPDGACCRDGACCSKTKATKSCCPDGACCNMSKAAKSCCPNGACCAKSTK